MINLKTMLLTTSAIILVSCGSNNGKEANAASETANSEFVETDITSDLLPVEDVEAVKKAPSPEAIANLKASKAFLTENAKKDGVTTLPSGLQYSKLKSAPDSETPIVPGDLIEFHFKLVNIFDGSEIISSRGEDGEGEAVQLVFNNNLIPVPTPITVLPEMRAGDHIEFMVPSELAFGENGTPDGEVGPNQAWQFDVELLKVTDAKTFEAQVEAAREEERLAYEKVATENLEASKVFLDKNATLEGVQTTPSGLQYKIISKGEQDGENPNETDTVVVNYKGTLRDGSVFDSSYDRGQPASFPLNGVIPGWTEGIQLMKAGDKFEFYIPAELAYGERGAPSGSIGPNEVLIFEVELLDVK